MNTLPEVGKSYIFTNADGVEIHGDVTLVQNGRVEFGKSHRVYIYLHGWTWEEKN